MCFMMDPAYGKKTCYVQFPQRFDGIDLHDLYSSRNIVFFDARSSLCGNWLLFQQAKALYGNDPVLTEEDLEPNVIVKSCRGSRKKGRGGNKKYGDKKRGVKRTESTIPIFNMEDDEGVEGYHEERSLLMSTKSLEKHFGQSPVFIAITLYEQGCIPPTTNPATLPKEAVHVISCGYEDKIEWGKEFMGEQRMRTIEYMSLDVLNYGHNS
ncbi:cellulose synthase A catalytic subunit 1 [Trifolium pratense]|uniref:Cellulose synthase A catalytic subunit 1 n=1 Tax=Trifolium pratense TaxID=57577 RepID=A0A2K3L4I4_TRIPR|nr:cellulose synthase A catalytic subunit 1 [Trifolium pratense]